MQLYVGGLSDDTTEVDVEAVFSGVCLPQLVTIIRDIESGKSATLSITLVHSCLNFGSILSRIQSPKKFPDNTTRPMARLGNKEIHQA
jgi:hypothetical protein